MPLLRFQDRIIHLSRVVEVHAGFQRKQESAYVVEAVQLVEDGDVVDVAALGGFAGWQGEVAGVRNEDKAISWGIEVAPGFVCCWGGGRGEVGEFFESDDLLWHFGMR